MKKPKEGIQSIKEKLGKIIDFAEAKADYSKKEEGGENNIRIMENDKYDVSEKVYLVVQNLISYFIEDSQILKDYTSFCYVIESTNDHNLSCGPRTKFIAKDALTVSIGCDLYCGDDNQLISNIFYEVAKDNKIEDHVLRAVQNLSSSFMGFYQYIGFKDDLIILKDIISHNTYNCSCTSGYVGEIGEIWFVRIVPNLDDVFNYHIILNTPYVFKNSNVDEWVKIFSQIKIENSVKSSHVHYYNLLKHPSDFMFWIDFIHNAYSNHDEHHAHLNGLPDFDGLDTSSSLYIV